MLGLATGGRHLLPPALSWGAGLAGLALLAGYLVHFRRAAHPLVNLRLLAVPTFRASVLGGSLFRVGVGATPFLLPLMLQLGFGLNPLESGLLTFASAAGALVMKALAARILRIFGFKAVLVVNAGIASAFLAATGFFTPATPQGLILAVLLVGGCFRSLQFTSLNAIAYADVTSREMSAATSLASVAQQIALSVGVAMGGFILEGAMRASGRAEVAAADFAPAFLAVAAVSALSGLFFLRLKPDAGAEMSGHRVVERKATADGA